jgi:hypothetical protein
MKVLLITSNLEGGGANADVEARQGLTEHCHDVTVLVLERRIEHWPPTPAKLESLLPAGIPLSGAWPGKRIPAWRLDRDLKDVAEPAPLRMV